MILVSILYCLFQILFYSIIVPVFRLPLLNWLMFLLVCIPFHGLILLAMIKLRHLFVLVDTKEALTKINISNLLSLFRISSIPTLLFLILSTQKVSLLIIALAFLSIVFITDFVDGKLARRLKQVTVIGQYLDSTSDYLVLITTSIIFLQYHIISIGFLILLLIRLFVVAGGNTLIFLRESHVDPQTSYLGKASVFAVMLFFAFRLLKFLLEITNMEFRGSLLLFSLIDRLEYMTEGVIVVSIVEKISLLRTTFKEIGQGRKKSS